MNIERVHQLIRNRKSVYPPQYIQKSIPKEIIQEILENANWAPTHKMTEPWRFKIFHGKSQKKLGSFMAEKYRSVTKQDDFSLVRYEKLKTNPQKAGCVIAICMQRDVQEGVPEWEEIAAVACGVQNMWLTAEAYQIGAYWSSPSVLEHFGELVPMTSGEICIGLFYMGYYNPGRVNRKRQPIEQKINWIE